MAEGGYKVNNFYQGGYSSIDPNKGEFFTGYHGKAGDLSTTTDPRTANLIKEVSGKLASGITNLELTMVNTQLFDSIPKDHLKEVQRLGKLTGAEFSVHGPVMDSAGFSQQGWNEVNRQSSERTMIDFIERAQEVNPQGNGIVVFHSADGIPSSDWQPTPDGRKYRRIIAVNRENGQMIPVESSKKFYPGEDLDKGHTQNPEQELQSHNNASWHNELSQVLFQKERADEIIRQNEPLIRELNESFKNGMNPERLTPTQRQVLTNFQTAKEYLDDVHKKINGQFSKAYELGTDEQKRELKTLSEEFAKMLPKESELGYSEAISRQSEAMGNLLNNMLENRKIIPKQFVPLEEFAIEKSSKTFGNTAFEAYKKFGDKAPVIAIENPPANQIGLSMGEELRKLVQESRKEFAEKLVKEKGMSQSQANKTAEKHIGATWDVGHINMIRKQGFTEKDVVKETEKIAPYVKHIHLSDNFGFEHTELPMGMGNVPFKEMMEKLPKKDMKKVIEAAQWWQHFQTNPFKESLVGVGSPIYSSGEGPFWNQYQGLQESYSSGYGEMLPRINYETFGSGFSRLPTELGGNSRGGGGSRMSGSPME